MAAAAEIVGELDKTNVVLKKIDSYYNEFVGSDFKKLGKS